MPETRRTGLTGRLLASSSLAGTRADPVFDLLQEEFFYVAPPVIRIQTPVSLAIGESSGTTPTVSDDFTPESLAHMFVQVVTTLAGTTIPDTAELIDSVGGTWAELFNDGQSLGTYSIRMQIFYRRAPFSPTLMNVSTDVVNTSCAIHVSGITDISTDFSNISSGKSTVGDPAVTLGSAPAASSLPMAWFGGVNTSTTNAPTDYSHLNSNTIPTLSRYTTEYYTGARPASASIAWTTGTTASIGVLLELKVGDGSLQGVGAGVLAPLVGSGTGTVEEADEPIVGVGAGTLAQLTGSGTGVEKIVGTGAGTLAQIVGAGTGVASGGPNTGVGAETLAPLVGAGTGRELIQGVASGQLLAPVGAGVGKEVIAGTGAGIPIAITGLGTGQEVFVGTAAGLLIPVTGIGTGREVIQGVVTGTLAPLVGVGSGSEVIQGIADGDLVGLVGTGLGRLVVQGVGTGILPSLTGTGFGSLTIVGSASGNLAQLVGSGFGYNGPASNFGVGAGTLGALTGAGTGTLTIRGSGTGALPGLSGNGTGVAIVQGAAAGHLGQLSGAGTGAIIIRGEAAGQLSQLLGFGDGVVIAPIVGSGNGILAQLVGYGVGTISGIGIENIYIGDTEIPIGVAGQGMFVGEDRCLFLAMGSTVVWSDT